MTRHRRPNSPPPPPAALEDEDLLAEILLRLPPQPSSLPRVSLTCRRWRRLVSDPSFLRRFRAHHLSRGPPPILGLFIWGTRRIYFLPVLKPPDCVPPWRFSPQIDDHADDYRIIGCRHGLALIVNVERRQAIVWDPITGDQCRLPIPKAFRNGDRFYSGAVLRAAFVGDDDRFQFQLVLVRCTRGRFARAVACVYSSDTGVWGDLIHISSPLLSRLTVESSGRLIGRFLYWSLHGHPGVILELDLDMQQLALIPMTFEARGQVMEAEGGGLGLMYLSEDSVKLWKRMTDCHGVASWALKKSIQWDTLLPPNAKEKMSREFLGFAEENNTLFMRTVAGIFMVQPESNQFKKLSVDSLPRFFYPFASVFTADMRIGVEHAGAELLHNKRARSSSSSSPGNESSEDGGTPNFDGPDGRKKDMGIGVEHAGAELLHNKRARSSSSSSPGNESSEDGGTPNSDRPDGRKKDMGIGVEHAGAELLQNKRARSSSSSSPGNESSEDGGTPNSDRPDGRKKEKVIVKKVAEMSSCWEKFEDMIRNEVAEQVLKTKVELEEKKKQEKLARLQEIKDNEEEKQKKQEEYEARMETMAKRKADREDRRLILEERAEEARIMMMDPSSMDEKARAYWEMCRNEILDAKRARMDE